MKKRCRHILSKQLLNSRKEHKFLLAYPSTATAANINLESEMEYFDDGSYIITTIDVEVQPTIALFSKTVTKSKTAKYYSGNIAKWYVKVTGTFTYMI